MDEATARERLIAACHRLLAEWRAGHDWRWYGHGEHWFDLSDLDFEFDRGWADYGSLSATWSYLDGFVDSMNHGFAQFDNLGWEDAVGALEEMTARLAGGRPVEDARDTAFRERPRPPRNSLGFLGRLFRRG